MVIYSLKYFRNCVCRAVRYAFISSSDSSDCLAIKMLLERSNGDFQSFLVNKFNIVLSYLEKNFSAIPTLESIQNNILLEISQWFFNIFFYFFSITSIMLSLEKCTGVIYCVKISIFRSFFYACNLWLLLHIHKYAFSH